MKAASTTKIVKPKNLVLTQIQKRRLNAVSAIFAVSEPPYKLTATIPFTNYLSGFMCMCRIVVHAEVLDEAPELTLRETSLKITLGSGKHPLSENELTLAEHIVRILSTTHTTK